MAKNLKTYTTSGGFYDLAVAAPSMKAALEAWGAGSNLFQQGLATQSVDPKVIAATMAKPGVVLRRPVGGSGRFSEHAELPKHLDVAKVPQPANRATKKPARPARASSGRVSQKAAAAFEKQRSLRAAKRREEESVRRKERERQDRAIVAAEAALQRAEQAHRVRADDIERHRTAVARREDAEDARWRRTREALEEKLRKARSSG